MTTQTGVENTSAEGGVRALERGLGLLRCFDVRNPSWTVSELAKASNLHKATTRRLVKTLEARRFLVMDPVAGAYRLGPAILPLTYLARSHDEFAQTARPFVQRLAAETGESVGLWVWTDAGMVQIACEVTSRAFKPEMLPGNVSVRYGTAFSKVLLALGPPERLGRMSWDFGAPNATIPSEEEIQADFDAVREAGIGYDLEATTPGLCAAAAPVLDTVGEVVASLSIVVPAERFGPEQRSRTVALTKEQADALSAEIGHLRR